MVGAATRSSFNSRNLTFMSLADEKYLALTTFTKDGRRKSTAVWIADLDGNLAFTTGANAWKLKRLRNDARCEVQPCNSRGVAVEGAVVATGTGREATAGELSAIRAGIKAKYGFQVTMIKTGQKLASLFGKGDSGGDTGIVITLD